MLFRTITKVEPQEKYRNRRNVYLDHEFGFAVHDEIYLKYGLQTGMILTQDQIDLITTDESRRSAKDAALRFLEHRSRSEKEIRQKLARYHYSEEIIEETIGVLTELKLVNDEDFARRLAQDKILTSPMGEKMLRQELWKKGIDDEIVGKTLREVLPESRELELATKIAKKKARTLKKLDDRKKKQKLSEFLARKGFDWDIIRKVVKPEVFED